MVFRFIRNRRRRNLGLLKFSGKADSPTTSAIGAGVENVLNIRLNSEPWRQAVAVSKLESGF